jgi:hypothetical protein
MQAIVSETWLGSRQQEHILHVHLPTGHIFKAKETPRGFWIYWAEHETWADMNALVRAGVVRDVPCGPATMGDVATYLTDWADKYKGNRPPSAA